MADFKVGDAMLTEQVVEAVNGLLAQTNSDDLYGIHVTAPNDELLDTTVADFATKFKDALKKGKATITRNGNGQTRLAMVIRVGYHYVTVAIDTDPANQQVVIVEPSLAVPPIYDAELAKIKQAIVDIKTDLTLPAAFAIANIQDCAVKVQNVPDPNDASCGPIASKMVHYFLTTDETLHNAISNANLAGKIINTPAQAKALFNEVNAAIKINERIDSGNCAVYATLMSIFNLVAKDKLDTAGPAFDVTRDKLLALYTAHLTKENSGVAPAVDATWDQFKTFVKNAKTATEQAALKEKFTPLWRDQFRNIFTDVPTKNAYAANLLIQLKDEFDSFYVDDNFDQAGTSYARFPWLQSEFAALKRTGKGVPWDEATKTRAFTAWWNGNKDAFFNELTKTGAWLSETDIAEYVKFLGNIDFDFQGRGKTVASNFYTPGYGAITQADLTGLIDAAGFEPPPDAERTAFINALCDDRTGILQKAPPDNYKFRRMTDADRQIKLNRIADEAWRADPTDAAKPVFIAALNAFCTTKEPYQAITLSNDSGNHWEVVGLPADSWLKDKDFTPQSKSKISTPAAIDLSTAEAKAVIKKVCADLQTENPTKRFAYNEAKNTVDVCGHQVVAQGSGFNFKTVTDEVIEFTVKAMAAQFDAQNTTKPVDRVVTLSLTAENREKYYEKFKAKCAEMKPPITLTEDVTNALAPAAPPPARRP